MRPLSDRVAMSATCSASLPPSASVRGSEAGIAAEMTLLMTMLEMGSRRPKQKPLRLAGSSTLPYRFWILATTGINSLLR